MTSLTSLFRRRLKVAAATAIVLTFFGTVAPIEARADQLGDYQAEASYLAARIAALGQHESALGEQYDAGVSALAVANARVAAAARALLAAKASQSKTVSLLQQDAVEAYMGGGPQVALSGGGDATNPDESLLQQAMSQTFAADQSDALDNYRLAADNELIAHQQLVAARNADARQLTRLMKDRQEVEAAQAQLVATEQQVKGKIAVLVAQIEQQKLLEEQQAEQAALREQEQEQAAAQAQAEAQQQAEAAQQNAAAAAAAKAAAAAETTTTAPPESSQSSEYVPQDQIPGVSPAASIAVAAAESRVGDPYVWGAAGPDEFDCSGLVMWAYDQAGVYLPHYSGSQYAETTQIPMSDLEPGDLVFPADPGQHVAIYVGNGEIVQAPYTGADVQIAPLTSYFVLATRVG
ncbi:MAG TPA: NlpC/P60 family protein [Acidimicrobiales bacterium]|nr:NlpC/P60 family protein [Acidimicrobiales bacterium]